MKFISSTDLPAFSLEGERDRKISPFVNANILLVDDDANICQILSDFLMNLGAKCSTTSIPTEAVEWIETREFDVIISDIYMPRVTGHDLLSYAIKYKPMTPVILMTGRPTLDNTIDAIRLGAYDYLVKPFNLDIVHVTVNRALNLRKLALTNKAYQDNLEKQVQVRTRELSEFLFHSVQSLSRALEARDPYTNGHGERVSRLVIDLAKELGVGEREFQSLRLAAQLHDIGKIGIPDSILLNKGRLSEEEHRTMKTHVEIGYQILSPIPSLREVSRYVYEHHERMDGKGYPRGLAGDEIHFNSRLLIVAEVCDALATVRIYKDAWPVEDIIKYFQETAGTSYDKEVVTALVSILNRNGHEIMKLFREGVTL